MNRIDAKFKTLKEKGQKGFIAYITAGDPDLDMTRQLVVEFEKRGVDIIELGVPFSDPVADGAVNQAASERALKAGTTLGGILSMIADVRRESEMPIVLFTYFNPIHQYGIERFIHDATSKGADGVLLVDVPPEEMTPYKEKMNAHGLATVLLVAPTSPDERIQRIAEESSGFIYYVSRTGVTGERDRLEDTIKSKVERIRACFGPDVPSKPIGVGFGISTPEQVRAVSQYADAVVVGSAIVRRIGEWKDDRDLIAKTGEWVSALTAPLKG